MPSQVSHPSVSAGSEETFQKADLENKLSQTRTSWSCMMRYSQTSVVERLELRLAGWCSTSSDPSSDLHLLLPKALISLCLALSTDSSLA
eukprot:3103468-Amphidinium_carterae.1